MAARLVLIMLAAAMLVGCHGDRVNSEKPNEKPMTTSAKNALLDTKWTLTELNGAAVLPAEPNHEVNLTFSSADQRVTGMASINRYSSKYTLDGDKLTILPGALTRMAGPEPLMKQEGDFLNALEAVKTYRVNGNVLELVDGSAVVAKFARE